ncbi:MAG TPA: site-specific DNA-methyltransferase [Firmicutes bacterium]|nr:site-specific DNA-methyltransferase [Bacillota bacterium]
MDGIESIGREFLARLGLGISDPRVALPAIARSKEAADLLPAFLSRIPTEHELRHGDARSLEWVDDESVHLVVTSPPYWTLKRYQDNPAQLGHIADYDEFLAELDKVWSHCLRVLIKGGRLVVVVGDVCLSRRSFGRHVVVPLHAAIQERCRRLGFDNLAPVIWYKIANARLEVENGSSFLGKPYEPNAIIKNDVEYILMQRKPGAYRSPSLWARLLSLIPEVQHRAWFRQIWQLPGASTRDHPAPFPVELAERLIRMFSFVGDTVLDPFMGTGTTNVAAGSWGRNSIGVEVEPAYFRQACFRLEGQLDRRFASLAFSHDSGTRERVPTQRVWNL